VRFSCAAHPDWHYFRLKLCSRAELWDGVWKSWGTKRQKIIFSEIGKKIKETAKVIFIALFRNTHQIKRI
jgi:hypothetical protein